MTTTTAITTRFWGVRGSVPAPLTGSRVEDKILQVLEATVAHPLPRGADAATLRAWLHEHVPFHTRATFGGNTSCVEVRVGGRLFILDMGTGLRELGVALLPEVLANGGLHGVILCSHVHWDHIQGFPFFAELYLPRRRFNNRFTFFGGQDWQKSLEEVLRGQMNTPVFPVDFREIERTGLQMAFETVHDGWTTTIDGDAGPITVTCRKLHHPQETYGYRISYLGRSVTYTTDHEPYASEVPPAGLAELVSGSDVWITDCQYELHTYTGEKGGLQRFDWGHSFPEYIASVARRVQVAPRQIATFHHDPASSDLVITDIAATVERVSGVPTQAAFEGLVLTC